MNGDDVTVQHAHDALRELRRALELTGAFDAGYDDPIDGTRTLRAMRALEALADLVTELEAERDAGELPAEAP